MCPEVRAVLAARGITKWPRRGGGEASSSRGYSGRQPSFFSMGRSGSDLRVRLLAKDLVETNDPHFPPIPMGLRRNRPKYASQFAEGGKTISYQDAEYPILAFFSTLLGNDDSSAVTLSGLGECSVESSGVAPLRGGVKRHFVAKKIHTERFEVPGIEPCR